MASLWCEYISPLVPVDIRQRFQLSAHPYPKVRMINFSLLSPDSLIGSGIRAIISGIPPGLEVRVSKDRCVVIVGLSGQVIQDILWGATN